MLVGLIIKHITNKQQSIYIMSVTIISSLVSAEKAVHRYYHMKKHCDKLFLETLDLAKKLHAIHHCKRYNESQVFYPNTRENVFLCECLRAKVMETIDETEKFVSYMETHQHIPGTKQCEFIVFPELEGYKGKIARCKGLSEHLKNDVRFSS